jgi:hypothetical protein
VHNHIDLCQALFYQNAARSMAAVGMLAPFIETIFTECFRGYGSRWPDSPMPINSNNRWGAAQMIYWDCHNVIENGKTRTDLVKGILQLADAIGLMSGLPHDIDKILSAIFGYRNKMFHCGFEWQKDEREKFQARIRKEKWPSHWFTTANSGGEPFIFYMSEDFIGHCLSAIDSILIAFGTLVRDRLYADEAAGR